MLPIILEFTERMSAVSMVSLSSDSYPATAWIFDGAKSGRSISTVSRKAASRMPESRTAVDSS